MLLLYIYNIYTTSVAINRISQLSGKTFKRDTQIFVSPPPMNISTTSSASSGASVVGAFRELQAKIKHVELDREAAFRERDKLQIELNESRRYLANVRRDTEANATEQILERRRRSDELSLEISELKMRIDLVQDSMTLTREKFETHRQELDLAMKSSKEVKGKISQAQRSVEVHRNDISTIDSRCRSLQEEVDLLRIGSASPQKEYTVDKVRILERELSDQKSGCEKAALRVGALQNYVGLLLQINGDLCSTMSSQEEARSKIARLSAQFLATPR
jgi:chromosome segregation ATPase